MSKVFYLCNYVDSEYMGNLVSFPSAFGKIEYVTETLKKLGYEVDVVSLARSAKKRFDKTEKIIDESEKHIYLSSFSSGGPLLKKVSVVFHWVEILYFLLKNVKREDKVIVYHSLDCRFWIYCYKKIFKKDFILQIEDVYTSVDKNIEHLKKKEWGIFALTDKHICVNDILCEQLNSKHSVISYGNYMVPKELVSKKSKGIKLVYAGVIEQKRKAAFVAVESMRFLDEEYELHILGFGEKENIDALKILIDEFNMRYEKHRIFFYGEKRGTEYFEFLQNCDIGLSTHSYHEDDMESADHTFPSKILTYMSNGLRVVAQELNVLKKSAIAEGMTFYKEPTPEEIAKAIMSVDLNDGYDSREIIKKLDEKFKQNLNELLEVL